MKGLLVIAHGAPSPEWVATVQEALQLDKAGVPAVLAFLEHVPGQDIHSGVNYLLEAKVKEIVAVPLFVSSYSVHIEEVKFLLGLPSTVSLPHKPVECPVPITLSKAMDDHPLIAEVLIDRAHSLGVAEGAILIVAYGSNSPQGLSSWDKSLGSLAAQVTNKTGLPTSFAWLTPNTIAASLEKLCQEHGSVAVVPLLLSHSHYTKVKIPQELRSHLASYSGEPLLPHPNVWQWILSQL